MYGTSSKSSIIIYLDLICIFSNITHNSVRNCFASTRRNPQDQIIETLPPKDIDMICCLRASTRIEAIWLMWHLEDFDLDSSWIVTFEMPAFVAHIAKREQVHCSITFAHNDAMVNVSNCDCSVNCDIELG